MINRFDADVRLKLDLHTHCGEAFIQVEPSVETVGQMIAAIEACGLDGIAVTEHWSIDYGVKVREIVDRHFDGRVLIIPGREINHRLGHMVELHLPGDTVFRFLAHPGCRMVYYGDNRDIHGIEIDNSQHSGIDRERVTEIAGAHNLLLLSNSDAHELTDIGRYYNVISLAELRARANGHSSGT